MTRVTVTLGGMAALLERLRVGDALRVAAERGGALLADGVRVRLSGTPGGAHNAPWLRSGGLRESGGVVVSAEGDVVRAVVGSSDPAAVAQELGTVHVPARPFLTPVGAELGRSWVSRWRRWCGMWLRASLRAEVMGRSGYDCFDDTGRMFDWAAPDRFFFDPMPVWPFDAGRLVGAPSVFRVPQVPVSEVFVRGEVTVSVAAGGLVGFDLRLVWPVGDGGPGVIAEREQLILAKRFAMAGRLEARG